MKRRNLKEVAKKFQKKLKKIKVAVFDVDGILTPGYVFWDGQEIGWNRHFNVYDGYGMNLLREAGLKVAIITGGNSDGVRRRFTENLKVDYLMMGNEDKREGYNKVKAQAGVKDEEIMYIGDELFDIPLLNKYYPGDLSHIKSIDLLESIRLSLGRRLRLDSVAEATIGAKKSAHGLQAVRWWKEGKIDEIKKYCEQDVRVTKKVFDYALKHGHVKFKDGSRKREIPLDISTWMIKEEAVMTHSLLF